MALAVGIVALGCGDDIKPISRRDKPSRGPVQPAATKSTPLPDLGQPIDHSPTMVGGNYTQMAYGFAYMRALLSRANADAKG